ncbi:MAG: hypothetical protein JXR94_16685, partial [Candidatus Hydrogenedentes bacterium]|nr:hypothetical protein [Candidatus Hydrogenedentota bacterium]
MLSRLLTTKEQWVLLALAAAVGIGGVALYVHHARPAPLPAPEDGSGTAAQGAAAQGAAPETPAPAPPAADAAGGAVREVPAIALGCAQPEEAHEPVQVSVQGAVARP